MVFSQHASSHEENQTKSLAHPPHDGERFHRVMSHIAGRRLTYEQLTGKGTDAVHQA